MSSSYRPHSPTGQFRPTSQAVPLPVPLPPGSAPSANVQAKSFLEQMSTHKDSAFEYFQEVLSKVDKHTLLVGVSIVATLGIGGAAAYYFYKKNLELKKRRKDKIYFQVDGGSATSPVKVRSTRSVLGDNEVSKPGTLVLHQCPRGRRTPCIAPYPLKLETFLRVHGINYEVDFSSQEPRTQGSPWITVDRIQMGDAASCMKYLTENFKINEATTDPKDQAIALAYTHLLEDHLYWGIALWRWVYDGAKSLPDIQIVSKSTMQMIPEVTRTVEQAAWFHGIGKKTPADVIESIQKDLKSLSDFLGSKRFFLGGDKASEIDCTAFAMLAQILWNMDNCIFHQTIKENHQNLSDFCWRMRARYWPDWNDCLNNIPFTDDE